MQANARVLAALLAGPDPDLARVVHHAVAAGDEAAVVAHAPAAARAAGRLGAHAQEAALQEQALRHPDLLDPAEEAALWRERTVTLFSLDRMPEAREAGRRAVARYEERDEPGPLAEALIALALVYWALVRPAESLAAAGRAVRVLEPGGDSHQLSYALAYLGGCWAASTATRSRSGRPRPPSRWPAGSIHRIWWRSARSPAAPPDSSRVTLGVPTSWARARPVRPRCRPTCSR
jgi:tetratricopeptide (TPR) repeat protein